MHVLIISWLIYMFLSLNLYIVWILANRTYIVHVCYVFLISILHKNESLNCFPYKCSFMTCIIFLCVLNPAYYPHTTIHAAVIGWLTFDHQSLIWLVCILLCVLDSKPAMTHPTNSRLPLLSRPNDFSSVCILSILV